MTICSVGIATRLRDMPGIDALAPAASTHAVARLVSPIRCAPAARTLLTAMA